MINIEFDAALEKYINEFNTNAIVKFITSKANQLSKTTKTISTHTIVQGTPNNCCAKNVPTVNLKKGTLLFRGTRERGNMKHDLESIINIYVLGKTLDVGEYSMFFSDNPFYPLLMINYEHLGVYTLKHDINVMLGVDPSKYTKTNFTGACDGVGTCRTPVAALNEPCVRGSMLRRGINGTIALSEYDNFGGNPEISNNVVDLLNNVAATKNSHFYTIILFWIMCYIIADAKNKIGFMELILHPFNKDTTIIKDIYDKYKDLSFESNVADLLKLGTDIEPHLIYKFEKFLIDVNSFTIGKGKRIKMLITNYIKFIKENIGSLYYDTSNGFLVLRNGEPISSDLLPLRNITGGGIFGEMNFDETISYPFRKNVLKFIIPFGVTDYITHLNPPFPKSTYVDIYIQNRKQWKDLNARILGTMQYEWIYTKNYDHRFISHILDKLIYSNNDTCAQTQCSMPNWMHHGSQNPSEVLYVDKSAPISGNKNIMELIKQYVGANWTEDFVDKICGSTRWALYPVSQFDNISTGYDKFVVFGSEYKWNPNDYNWEWASTKTGVPLKPNVTGRMIDKIDFGQVSDNCKKIAGFDFFLEFPVDYTITHGQHDFGNLLHVDGNYIRLSVPNGRHGSSYRVGGSMIVANYNTLFDYYGIGNVSNPRVIECAILNVPDIEFMMEVCNELHRTVTFNQMYNINANTSLLKVRQVTKLHKCYFVEENAPIISFGPTSSSMYFAGENNSQPGTWKLDSDELYISYSDGHLARYKHRNNKFATFKNGDITIDKFKHSSNITEFGLLITDRDPKKYAELQSERKKLGFSTRISLAYTNIEVKDSSGNTLPTYVVRKMQSYTNDTEDNIEVCLVIDKQLAAGSFVIFNYDVVATIEEDISPTSVRLGCCTKLGNDGFITPKQCKLNTSCNKTISRRVYDKYDNTSIRMDAFNTINPLSNVTDLNDCKIRCDNKSQIPSAPLNSKCNTILFNKTTNECAFGTVNKNANKSKKDDKKFDMYVARDHNYSGHTPSPKGRPFLPNPRLTEHNITQQSCINKCNTFDDECNTYVHTPNIYNGVQCDGPDCLGTCELGK